jgi:putative DNA methylase
MKKKLIEVALPLEAINEEASLRKRKAPSGYPTTLHKWWAQRPLAACRAILFASLVDDPSSYPERFRTKEAQDQERQRLFRLLEELVKWDNSTNDEILGRARDEIRKSTGNDLPVVLDPFCGGGSIPLEAQRLGLKVQASDLNPVAVLITKALIEIPPKFANLPPVHESRDERLIEHQWRGAQGLAEDIQYYAAYMRNRAEDLIGHLYPKAKVTSELAAARPDLRPYLNRDLTVVARLWARTVVCPNPACGARMPLIRSFWLSRKADRHIYLDPKVDHGAKRIRFGIRLEGEPRKETSNRKGGVCLFCDNAIGKEDLRQTASRHGIGEVGLAIVCDADRKRVYLPFDAVAFPSVTRPAVPEVDLPMTNDRRWFSPPLYGLPNFKDLFTDRQLVALTTFSDLIGEARANALADAKLRGLADDGVGLELNGCGATAYADAIAVYLSFVHSRLTDYGSSLSTWRAKDSAMRSALAKQALPMVWDFAEGNPFAKSSAGIDQCASVVAGVIELHCSQVPGEVRQLDATAAPRTGKFIVCTDPPYYDNIGYAGLSDFFYVWLRRHLAPVFPQLFSTVLVPKSSELIAAPVRFDGDAEAADRFFESGFRAAFGHLVGHLDPQFPLTVFYALKQSETDDDADDEQVVASTGWETMLAGLLGAGLSVRGTWPLRTEGDNRQIGHGANALASSVVLVCWPRNVAAALATRGEFLRELKRELPDALRLLQGGSIAPVDLAQAAIGPGMAVFSRYSRVIESDGSPMQVRTALALINQVLDEVLAEQEGEFDADTRWAVIWFDQHAMDEASFGEADVLARAKNTSVQGLVEAGVVSARAGKVRLVRRDELPRDWNPATDGRLSVWEVTQHLIRTLEQEGALEAASLLQKLGGVGESAKDLAYRLYNICERRGWAPDALAYNSLVVAWVELATQAAAARTSATQTRLI